MAFRTISLADDSCGVDYFYWNKAEGQWRTDNTAYHRWVNVYYWTESDPEDWVDSDPPLAYRKKAKSNPALEIAWNNVQEAVRQYEIIKALT